MAVTLNNILMEVRLPKAALEERCSEEHASCISVFLDWRRVAPHLGITKTEKDDIECNLKSDSERALECLRRWKEIHTSKATYLMLVEILLMVGLPDQAEKICKFVHKSINGTDESPAVMVSTPSLLSLHHDGGSATTALPESAQVKDQLELSSIHDQHNSTGTTELGTTFPSPTALLTTTQSLEPCAVRHHYESKEPHVPSEHEALSTPPLEVPLPQTLLPEKKAQKRKEYCFDIFAGLLGAGVPHTVLLITSYLSLTSLAVAEKVSTLWRDIIEDLPFWKKEVLRNLETSHLWQDIFDRRGWHKYVSQEIPHSGSLNYLYRQIHRSISKDIHSLEANWRRGHYTLTTIETGSGVKCLQYDSRKLYQDMIWDKDTLKLLMILTGHKKSVLCLQFSNEIVISGSRDHSVKVWNAQTGLIVSDLHHHKDWVRALKFNSGLLVTGSDDKTVVVWVFKKPTDITPKMVLKGHYGLVYAVDISDTYIISGSSDESIKVWDRSTGRLLHTLQHNSYVWSLQYRGGYIVSGCDDGIIKLWDSETGSCLREWEGHDTAIRCVALDDKRIVTGSEDRTVKVWSMSAVLEPSSFTDALCVPTLKEHSGYVKDIQFDYFKVVSGGEDGMINLHDFWDPLPAHHILGPQQLI